MNEVSRNFFRADERNFRDLKKTPTKTRIKRCAFSVRSFPRLRAFSGHTYYKTRAAFTFPAGALSRKLGALAQKCDFACASILAHTIL
ncbi:MAG TPA: hypothetical protein H9851_00255, partial [Candidatus Borkfalkia faecavium]|nr:hypothetical protein [Candidatus Borkfalkia faecavium]